MELLLEVFFRSDILNAFDKKGLYNFQSVFGGTHVIPPRTIAPRYWPEKIAKTVPNAAIAAVTRNQPREWPDLIRRQP